MNAQSFMKALEAQWPREPIPEESARVYRVALSAYTSTQLQKVYERIIQTEQYTPKLSRILDVARELGYMREERRELRAVHFQTFDLDGVHYARPIRDPANPPGPPHGATNVRVHVDSQQRYQDDEPISGAQAQAAFEEGWRRSGVPMDQCPRASGYLRRLQSVPEIADYDDSTENESWRIR